MNLLKITEKIVKERFGVVKPHFKRTLYWVKYLDPQASEIVQSAALAHDIGRSILSSVGLSKQFKRHDGNDVAYLKHQKLGYETIYGDLIKNGIDEEIAKKVAKIVEFHERGGWLEADLVKDADSVSFFEGNAPRFASDPKFEKLFSWKSIRQKFEWMFNRISSEKARTLAKPMYEKALADLEKKIAARHSEK